MESIDFSTFAQITAPFLKGDMSQAEYARTLLLGICAFEDLDENPVSDIGDESMKRYFTGERGIGTLASKIVPFLDPELLESLFSRLGFEAEMELYKRLSPYCAGITDNNVTTEAPRLLARVITEASCNKRGTRRTSNPQEVRKDDLTFMQEVNCRCPLCSRKLIRTDGGKTAFTSIVTRITPSSLDSAEINSFKKAGIELPEPDSPSDYIALCLNCSHEYRTSATKESVKHLLDVKKSLQARNAIEERLDRCEIEDEIEKVLRDLCSCEIEGNEVSLRLDALALKDKIEDSEALLKNRISQDVASYYRFVERSLRDLSEEGHIGFDSVIASQVQAAYRTAALSGDSQTKIYDALVGWLHEKTPTCDRMACEIVVAFFVQNCEVFDEIAR